MFKIKTFFTTFEGERVKERGRERERERGRKKNVPI
jgi:hypothetical protein